MSVKCQHNFNDFLFAILNEFTAEEFAKFTNFTDILLTIFDGKDFTERKLAQCIEQNLKLNVPNKAVWSSGGFNSIKLTEKFYGSQSAERILSKIYGLRKCTVDVVPIQKDILTIGDDNVITVDSESPVDTPISRFQENHSAAVNAEISSTIDKVGGAMNSKEKTSKQQAVAQNSSSSGKKSKPKLRMKYPRKVMIGSYPVDSEAFKLFPNVGGNTSPIDSSERPVPLTKIPFENVASYIDESDIRQFFRKRLHDRFEKIELEFERYMATNDVNYLSLNDFWQQYCDAAPATKRPDIVIEAKVEKSFHIQADGATESQSNRTVGFEIVYVDDESNDAKTVILDCTSETPLPALSNNIDDEYAVETQPVSLRNENVNCGKVNLKRQSDTADGAVVKKRKQSTNCMKNYQEAYWNFLERKK